MARSRLLTPSLDLVNDGGTVLFSLVQGEQIEYPITLDFLSSVAVTANNYTFEAVVVEAENVSGQETYPSYVRTNGAKTTLFVRLPYYLGEWDGQYSYNKEEVVLFNEKYYKLLSGAGYISAVSPDTNPLWEETVLNKLYVQFPASLAADWAVKPSPLTPGYGFFELRITEPNDSVFSRTLKPVRGLIEVLYSPSEDTPDTPSQST